MHIELFFEIRDRASIRVCANLTQQSVTLLRCGIRAAGGVRRCSVPCRLHRLFTEIYMRFESIRDMQSKTPLLQGHSL